MIKFTPLINYTPVYGTSEITEEIFERILGKTQGRISGAIHGGLGNKLSEEFLKNSLEELQKKPLAESPEVIPKSLKKYSVIKISKEKLERISEEFASIRIVN